MVDGGVWCAACGSACWVFCVPLPTTGRHSGRVARHQVCTLFSWNGQPEHHSPSLWEPVTVREVVGLHGEPVEAQAMQSQHAEPKRLQPQPSMLSGALSTSGAS